MRPITDVERVFVLRAEGRTAAAIAAEVGMSLSQVHRWLRQGEVGVANSPMRLLQRCLPDVTCPLIDGLPPRAYAYLLGQYLGDGCIVTARTSEKLTIATSEKYPAIRAETARAMADVMPGHAVSFARRPGWTAVYSYSCHWPCLFPQHGPGRKHLRPIVLDSWQERIAIEAHPDQLVRGLIHSDGCRCVNRVRRGEKTYEYIRYFLDNRSDDIHQIFAEACERLSVDVQRPKPSTSSVARARSVQVLERLVGPKS